MRHLVPSLAALVVYTSVAAQGPVVPGEMRLRDNAEVSEAERGFLLLGELGCTGCHEPAAARAARLTKRLAPDLGRVGARVTPQYLRRFLDDPHRVKPGTLMPSLWAGVDADTKAESVAALVHFLVSRGGPIEPARSGGSEVLVARGRELFHSIGCAACHAPDRDVTRRTTVPSIPLGDLARKTTVDELVVFLLDPHAARPSGRMPNFALDPKEARALAVYLLREQLENPQTLDAPPASRPGIAYEYYEHDFGNKLGDFDALEPTATGIVERFTIDVPERLESDRGEEFALRFTAALDVERRGEYRFFTSSDDGSQLFIDGELVVNNDGLHGNRSADARVRLAEGPHEIVVTMFEHHGGEALSVHWQGPGFGKQQIPLERLSTNEGRTMVPIGTKAFTVDADKARRGAALFGTLGCASCHGAVDGGAVVRSKPLASLAVDDADGCLGDRPGRGAADYALTGEQRSALRAALVTDPRASESDAISVRRSLAAHNCYGCHERDGIGGVEEARWDLFKTTVEIDLGDEGRFPPRLDAVGSRLRQESLSELLVDGQHQVRREYMATRMPRFREPAMTTLVRDLVAVDRKPGDLTIPEFSEEAVVAGRRLVGSRGFSCVACHSVNGNLGNGIPGLDLATTYARLNPGWFRRYLWRPADAKPGTRMPTFWGGPKSAFADLIGGDSMAQIDAIYTYLSLGTSLPPPIGVTPKGSDDVRMELVPIADPIVHRTFMEDVGPRTILVGFPENLHVAFDAHSVRFARIWRGRFFDHSGVASGRTDKFLGPLGDDVVDVPAGPSFARLTSVADAWPTIAKTQRNVGGRFKGYRLDAERRPVFRYELDGVTIEEQPTPVLRPGGSVLRRGFRLTASGTVGDLWFLAWAGNEVERKGESTFRADAVTVELTGVTEARIRTSGDRQEILVPIPFDRGVVEFEEVVRW